MGWHVGLTTGGFRSTLVHWGDQEKVGIEKVAVTASLDKRFGDTWDLAFGVGSVLAGTLTAADGLFFVEQGVLGSVSLSRTFVQAKGAVPFFIVSGALAASYETTRAGAYIGTDIRAAATLGWTLWDRFSPYLAARVFGGIAFWRQQMFSDLWHFQVGAGFVLGLPGGFDLNAEFIPLGEQRFSVGVGYSF